jgi:hypothetical protein
MLLTDLHIVYIDALFVPSFALLKFDVVAAHLALPHSPIFSKRPVLEAITPLPLHPILRILILVPKLNRNLVVRKSKELLAQTVVVLALPFLCEECYNLVTALDEVRADAPYAIGRICFSYGGWIS